MSARSRRALVTSVTDPIILASRRIDGQHSQTPFSQPVLTFVLRRIRPDYTQITTIFFLSTEHYALSRCYAQRADIY